jgi:hypothetical protein
MRLQKGFSIAMTSALLLGLLSVATIAVAYYFIDKTRNNTFEENIVSLNSLQRLDAKWSESLLKTHSYTLQDFDQLSHYMTKIRQGLDTLDQQGMPDKKVVGNETAKQYQIYKYSFATKNEAIEHYKSQQAILRNSVRYLPEAGEMAQQTLAKTNSLENKKITDLLTSSTLTINQYLLNIVDAKVVKEKLDALMRQSANKSDAIKKDMLDYLVHSSLVMKHKPKVDEMLQTAMSVDIAKLSTQLINEYIHSQDNIKQRIKSWQQVMLAGILMLLALLVWFLLSLRKSASKILLANTKNKTTQQQLIVTEEQIKKANKNMVKMGQQVASGQLMFNTFKRLNTTMPALAEHISFIQTLKTNSALSKHANKMDRIIEDLDDLHNKIQELSTLIDPQENKNKHVSFNFNHVIQSAFDSTSSSLNSSATFNKQLSAVPSIQANAIELYQIASKLLHLSILSWQAGDESIFIKTWATGHYANLCLSLSGYDNLKALYAEDTLSDLRELLEKNSALLKLTPRKDGKSAIVWVSFPYS